jgi:hypothetical protein
MRGMLVVLALGCFAIAAYALTFDHHEFCDRWAPESRYSGSLCLESHVVQGPNYFNVAWLTVAGIGLLWTAFAKSKEASV